jgi:hypothetical protein
MIKLNIKENTMKPYGKFNVVLFVDGGFDSLVSKHRTRQTAVKAAAAERNAHRQDANEFGAYDCKFSFRVVTAGALKNAFALEVR